ncbi:MAG: putative metal-binding motif-containing protein, partial [Deltaproteobacteria bacterium]|nr:putative metal-binding motif-containing protein [Deltaproteobacteria bacterium]
LCNGIDDDCDGSTDEDSAADASTWYADGDGDGYGDASSSTVACDAPAGSVADATDCDDTSSDVSPAATELCNGIDDDCDGSTDEDSAADASTWYADADGDGYGNATSRATACDAPTGFIADDSDCDDGEASVNPAATEVCDGLDNDCDGNTDPDDAWWDTSFPYRILLTVTASGYAVDSPPVLADIDFRGALDDLGDSSAWDSDTLRVVTQSCASGQVELPSQYLEDHVGLLDKLDAADSTAEYGTVAFLADQDGDYGTLDAMAAGTSTSIGLYFGGSNSAPAYATDLVATASSLANDVTTATFDEAYGGVLTGLSHDGSTSLENQYTSCCGNSIYGGSWGIDPQDGTGDLAVLFDGPVVAALEATGSRSDSQSGYEYSYIYLAFAGRPEIYSKVYQVTDRASTLAHPTDIAYGIRPWESRRDNISGSATFTTDSNYLYADASNGTWGIAFAYVAPPEFLIGLANYDPYLIAVSNDYTALGLGTPATLPAGTAYFDHVVQLHLPHAGDFDTAVQDTLFGLAEGVMVVQAAAESR